MLLYGIEKNSLNDFPGKVSCVIFIHGCNFFCPYCQNPQLVLNKSKYWLEKKDVLVFLEKRKKFYDGVVISGGEPTLHSKLFSLCHELKNMGYKIKLDTNGSRPKMLEKLINKGILDYIAMDIKTELSENPYKQFTNETDIVGKVKNSIKLIMNEATNYEFRTTCVNPFINNTTIERICLSIKGAESYVLQPFNKNAHSILNKKFFINIKQDPAISRKNIFSFLKIANFYVKNSKISFT